MNLKKLLCIIEKLQPKKGIKDMNISQEGLGLIKKFEGCELEAYKCAAGVWTIGYGSTKNVNEGDTITQEEADELSYEIWKEAAENSADYGARPLTQELIDDYCLDEELDDEEED